ncbi:MAG: ABC transporter ATP-binding protein [Alphaproteobacteria bacterium]|nr:ABC transporter ATP-binding protein [Alphaproteobacteria bacterium]
MSGVLELEDVRHVYRQGKQSLEILKGVDLRIMPGEIVALIGPSGAGKSTLLHICGLLETPTSGSVAVSGVSCAGLPDAGRTALRRDNIGFVYQYHNLLPEFSALENVLLPAYIAGTNPADAKARAMSLLETLELGHRIAHRPAELSGGEQQRVAIARALINRPQLLLADEPTGNLDPNTAGVVFKQLLEVVRKTGLAALIATHNAELADRMDRKLSLRDGKLLQLASFTHAGG